MVKKSGGLGKLFKDVKKSQKKVDKLFGSKPAPKKAAPAPKEPKEVTKTGKLTGLNKEAAAEADYVEIIVDDERWAATYDGVVIGYLPAALSKYMTEHEDDLQDAEYEDGSVTLTFIIE